MSLELFKILFPSKPTSFGSRSVPNRMIPDELVASDDDDVDDDDVDDDDNEPLADDDNQNVADKNSETREELNYRENACIKNMIKLGESGQVKSNASLRSY